MEVKRQIDIGREVSSRRYEMSVLCRMCRWNMQRCWGKSRCRELQASAWTVDELCAGQEEELERVCMRQSDTVLFRVKCHESILSLARQKSRSYRESGQCTALERVKGVNGRLWFERQWLSLTHWWVLPRRVVQTAHRRDGWRDYVRYTEQTKRVTSTHTSSGCCFPRPVTSGDAQRRFLHNVRFKHSTQN